MPTVSAKPTQRSTVHVHRSTLQWITFPRFVLSGGWSRYLRRSPGSRSEPS